MAVGMNIDIASIDMVSEVNMVSTEVYGCVSADLHLGTGSRKEPVGGGGVCMSMYMKWGGEGWGFCFGAHCVGGFKAFAFLVPHNFSNLVWILGNWYRASKMPHNSCAKHSHMQKIPCRSHFS